MTTLTKKHLTGRSRHSQVHQGDAPRLRRQDHARTHRQRGDTAQVGIIVIWVISCQVLLMLTQESCKSRPENLLKLSSCDLNQPDSILQLQPSGRFRRPGWRSGSRWRSPRRRRRPSGSPAPGPAQGIIYLCRLQNFLLLEKSRCLPSYLPKCGRHSCIAPNQQEGAGRSSSGCCSPLKRTRLSPRRQVLLVIEYFQSALA